MQRRTQIGLGVIILLASSLVVLYASVTSTSVISLVAIALASLGLAVGALLVGASGTTSRIV